MIYNNTTRYYMLLQEETTIILVFTSNITNTSLIVILTDSFHFANSDFWGVCACYFLRISAMKVLLIINNCL